LGALDHKTFVHQAEESAAGRQLSKDRITFMPCSNVSGTHKLEMLVIGKAAKPRAFKTQSIPIIYKGQSHGWVTREVFTEWFHESFEPSVKTFLKKQNLPAKSLLILDNAPGHTSEGQLKLRDGLIELMFLPPDYTPLLQSTDQDVIQFVKSHYKKGLLCSVISLNDDISQCLKRRNQKT
jgi:hypothetical protein